MIQEGGKINFKIDVIERIEKEEEVQVVQEVQVVADLNLQEVEMIEGRSIVMKKKR